MTAAGPDPGPSRPDPHVRRPDADARTRDPGPRLAGPGRPVDTDSTGARLVQAAMAVVLAIVSVVLMVTTHRVQIELLGVDWPAGLLFGAAFQIVTCVFLYAATGSRLPLLVLGSLWGLLAMPLMGRGVGGGVLMPAVIGEQAQYSGWIVQGLGLAIPFLAAGWITVRRLRAPARRGPVR